MFHKPGADGSSKADAYWTGKNKDYVLGVVYELSRDDMKILDMFEGHPTHYLRRRIQITDNKVVHRLWIYCAMLVDVYKPDPPCVHYLQHIITGAVENEFPVTYTNKLLKLKTVDTKVGNIDEILSSLKKSLTRKVY